MMASRGDVSILDTMVHFDVRGKEFSLPLDALELYPESYIAWLVRNNLDSVRAGKPISINRKPEAFKSLLENISKQSTRQPSSPIDHGSSMPDPRTMSDIPQSLRERMPNGGGGHHPPPPPPPPQQKKGHSHAHMHFDAGEHHHHHHHHSELSQQKGHHHTQHSSFHSMQVSQQQQQHPSHKLLQHQNSSGRPKNPYEAFHGMHSRHARRPTTSASTYKGKMEHKPMEFETMSSSSEMTHSPKLLPTGPTRLVAPKGTDEVVEDAVQEISSILRRYQKQHQLYDKALIVLSWGRNGEGDRVLRPQLSKLYDSMTGRVHDIRRSSDGSGSFERHATSGWNTFDSVYSATCISSRVQTLVVEGLRAAGCAACFSEVKLDRNGVVDWRGSRRDLYPAHKFESATVRCLVVTLR